MKKLENTVLRAVEAGGWMCQLVGENKEQLQLGYLDANFAAYMIATILKDNYVGRLSGVTVTVPYLQGNCFFGTKDHCLTIPFDTSKLMNILFKLK